MSALERVREKFKTLRYGTDKTDKRASVSSVSSHSGHIGNISRLDAELERRIRTMARRWRYTEAELHEVLALAADDPARWLLAVNLDERKFGTGEEWPLQ
jgi:hypothetical protein